jgi:hypothetical protein
MGMFDWYRPQPPVNCPICGTVLSGWQGKSGSCGLFEWVQGHRIPEKQIVDNQFAISDLARQGVILPEDFELYTSCGTCKTWIEAHGWCDDGIWNRVELVNPVEPPGLPEGWMPLDIDERTRTLSELRREITADHILQACRLFPLARRRSGDAVLIRAVGTVESLWVVNLIWRKGKDYSQPIAQPFESMHAFVAAHEGGEI